MHNGNAACFECRICFTEVDKTKKKYECGECRNKVCSKCVLKLNKICDNHRCIHIKCPFCRTPTNIEAKDIKLYFLDSNEQLLVLGNHILCREDINIIDDVTIINVKIYRRDMNFT